MSVPRLAAMALALAVFARPAVAADATALIKAAFDNWRAQSSQSTLVMTIHRPGWERHLTMTGWTRGDDEALVRFTAPAKEAGNATLRLPSATYIFNPKLNQVVKLPASMMSQSWMGSDFSYSDLSKSEELLTRFHPQDHRHHRFGRAYGLSDRGDPQARRAGGLGQGDSEDPR